MNVALATCKEFSNLSDTEKPLIDAFRQQGITALPVVWNDSSVDWKTYDAVVIRSIWDYHMLVEQFYEWLTSLDNLGVRVFNDTAVLRWNSNKRYLIDLKSKGLPVVRTEIISSADNRTLDQILTWEGVSDYVIKPCYGASAFGVERVNNTLITHESEVAYDALKQHSDVLLQAFVPEITAGEVSAIFIGGKFSHAVLKKPGKGDFRSNFHHGANETEYFMEPQLLDEVMRIYADSSYGDTLYARVDFVLTDGKPKLMELELLEPYLFFELNPQSYERFVVAFKDRI